MYEIGDIVQIINSVGYPKSFIVTNFIIEDNGVTDYEIGQIFPIIHNRHFTLINAKDYELKLIAKYKTEDYETIMNYIINEKKMIYFDYENPIYLDIVDYNLNGIVSEPNTFNVKKFKKSMEDKTTEKVIDVYVERMDNHLDLLNVAIKKGDKEAIAFQKEQLEKVRKKLMELEYFNLSIN